MFIKMLLSLVHPNLQIASGVSAEARRPVSVMKAYEVLVHALVGLP